MKKCPFCQEEIQDTALKCRYCGEWLSNKPNDVKNADSNLFQHDQTFEDDSVYNLDLTEMASNETNIIQAVDFGGGITYIGQLVNGVPSGHGTLYNSNGAGHKYEGQFDKGLPNGNGTKTFSDGLILRCKWRDGNPIEDEVTMIFRNGSKYIGAVNREGEFYGHGTVYLKDGRKISAYWENSKPIGNVTCIDSQNNKYEGEFKDMNMHGKGVFISADCIIYEGEFKNNVFDGYGTITNSDGEIIAAGLFRDGKYIGKET